MPPGFREHLCIASVWWPSSVVIDIAWEFPPDPPSADSTYVQIYGQHWQSAGSSRPGKAWQRLASVNGGTVFDVALEYETAFGLPPIGTRLWFKLVPLGSTGSPVVGFEGAAVIVTTIMAA